MSGAVGPPPHQTVAAARRAAATVRVGLTRGPRAGRAGSLSGLAGLDLRLAGVAGGTWLSALAVLHTGIGWAVGLAVVAVLCAVGLARCRVGIPRFIVGTALGVLLGVVCGASATAARVAVRDSPSLAEMVEARTTIRAELIVRDDPRPARAVSGRPPVYVIAAEINELTTSDRPPLRLHARILLLASDPAWRTVLPGQTAVTSGRLAPPRGADLRAAVLSVTAAPEWLAPAPWHQRIAGALRAGLQRACEPLPDGPGGLLPGLVVGDTSALSTEVSDDFRATGMTHLVAVSGANVAIIIGAALLLARWSRAGPRLAAGLAFVGLIGFVVLARPSPSVLRAAVMGGLGLMALASARQRAAVPALCASVALLVIADPELAGDAGFALSVLATGGLLIFAPRWRDGLRQRGVPAGLAEALAVPAAAQMACAPVIAAMSGGVSLVAIPANLLAIPAVAPATVLGVAAALLSPLWAEGAIAAAWLGQWPARWLVAVAGHGADVPAGSVPWPAGTWGGLLLAAVLLGLLFAARRPPARRVVLVVAVAAMIGALPVRFLAAGWPPPGWIVVACAVGQGDAVVLPIAPGAAAVVDAGPDPSSVDRCLQRLGITSVPLLVITHFHADHVGGVAGVFRGRAVSQVVGPAWPEPAHGRAIVNATAGGAGAPVREVGAGWAYAFGDLRLTALGPPWTISGTRSDPNNNSLVIRATIRGISIVLAGDAEAEEQEAILRAYGPAAVRCDIAKIAHHGSPFQDAEFLDATAPRVALVSVGAGNPYGHPNAAVLERLARGGARILRTDLTGDAATVVENGRLAVVTAGVDRPP